MPIHGWIQINFDVCDVTRFRNTHKPFVRHNRDVHCSDTSMTQSTHTPQSPMNGQATCLQFVRALRPRSSRTPSSISNASFTMADVVSTALRTPHSAMSRHTFRCLLFHITDIVTSCASRDSWPAFQLAVRALCNLCNPIGQVLELHRLDNAIKSTFGHHSTVVGF